MKKSLLFLLTAALGVFTLNAQTVDLKKATISVDGEIDDYWDEANGGDITNIIVNNSGGDLTDENLSGSFKMLYDDDNLYILLEVTDDVQGRDGWGEDDPPFVTHQDDGFDIPIDLLNGKEEEALTDPNDAGTHVMLWGCPNAAFDGVDLATDPKYSFSALDITGAESALATVEGGYFYELSVPLTNMWADGVTVGQEFGIDVRLNDDDLITDPGARVNHKAWAVTPDGGWNTPADMGTAKFTDDEITSIFRTTAPTFKVAPNPATEVIYVSNIELGSTVSVLNMLGQEMKSVTAENENIQISVSGLNSGIYFVKVGDTASKVLIK